ncbi:MAG: ExeA family protein [Candidatus Krumholzibacteriia bacterium]
MRHKLKAYGLKWDPFSREVPPEALFRSAPAESLCWRTEHVLLEDGGFASVIGDPGTGKSACMRLVEQHLLRNSGAKVVSLEHASGSVSSFYRELGERFGVELTPRNRWGGFKALRECWCEHMESTLLRPVLLVDEAQEMNPKVLTELRILSSTRFDSRVILGVVLAGDRRLHEKLRHEELAPLGSRLRVRIFLEPMDKETLLAVLDYRLNTAGGTALLTEGLKTTIVERAAGNPRTMLAMGQDLLVVAVHRELKRLDEKLFLEVFGGDDRPQKRRRRTA